MLFGERVETEGKSRVGGGLPRLNGNSPNLGQMDKIRGGRGPPAG